MKLCNIIFGLHICLGILSLCVFVILSAGEYPIVPHEDVEILGVLVIITLVFAIPGAAFYGIIFPEKE